MTDAVKAAIIGGVFGLLTAAIALAPTYLPHADYDWRPTGQNSACAYDDTSASYNVDEPDKKLCDFRHVDTIAVCWNGADKQNGSNPAGLKTMHWCTYKTTSVAECLKKTTVPLGTMWVCLKK